MILVTRCGSVQRLARVARLAYRIVSRAPLPAYIEILTLNYKAPTVKQHLAALRMLYDWLIVGQVVEQNPAAAVHGPKHIV